jgi:hypothetical protein
LDDFYKHPAMADGHLGKCKECTKKDVATRQLNKPDMIAAYEKKRLHDPSRKAKCKAYVAASKKRNPEDFRKKVSARRIARTAILSGKLIPKPCVVCGKEPVHAHHPDYDFPLEVVWLCPVCHSKEHRK